MPQPREKSAQSSNLHVLNRSFRAPAREKWHPTADLARQTPREAARLHERKVWQTRVLQSIAAASKHGKMALLAVEKAPFCAIFRPFFVDFPRVFSTSLFVMALWREFDLEIHFSWTGRGRCQRLYLSETQFGK